MESGENVMGVLDNIDFLFVFGGEFFIDIDQLGVFLQFDLGIFDQFVEFIVDVSVDLFGF